MFTRSGNWKKDKKYLQTKIMVGSNIKSGGIEQIELKEYLVDMFLNDQNKISSINIKPILLKYLTFRE